MNSNLMYFLSNLGALLSCLLVVTLYIVLIISAKHAPQRDLIGGIDTPTYIRRSCIWFMVLIISLGIGVGLDWINDVFKLGYNAGRWRNFIIMISVSICGFNMFHNTYMNLSRYKRDL